MRLIGTASIAFLLALTVVTSQPRPAPFAQDEPHAISRQGDQSGGSRGAGKHLGRAIFRDETFGDEQLWTGVLRMHEVLAEVAPATALAVGLKIDVEALTGEIVAALKADDVDLMDPAVTLELLRLNAVVGVRGKIDSAGRLTSVGITCALCHSTVDNSLTPGIGARLDGWANVDLNVGAIVALSPALDDATKAEFNAWGPGKYDPRHHAFDGTNLLPLNSPSVPIVIPPIYGLKGVGFETFTGDGPIWYWNSYVGVGQMGGQGTFNDPRIGLFINQRPDLVTPNASCSTRLSTEPRDARAAEGNIQPCGSHPGQTSISARSQVRHLPRASQLHRRGERSQARAARSAYPRGGRDGPDLRGTECHRAIPDDALARTVATRAVFS